MELRQLRCVEAVARLHHFTRAAEELHLAQSALSHQIRQLERELGTPLFERTSRRVRPTEAGEVIAVRARRVLAELDLAREEVDELRSVLRGRIRIGPLLPAGDVDVSGILAGFSKSHPGVEVSLREGTAADMLDRLATDELDAAFCLMADEPPGDLAFVQLGHDEVAVMTRLDLAPPAPHVSISDLAQETIIALRRGSTITSIVEALFAKAGLPLRLALESGDPFLLRSLAARGFATAIVPRSLAALPGPAVEIRSLDPAVQLTVALVWRHGRNLSPAARTFIEYVRRETAT